MNDYSGLCMGCLNPKGQEPICPHCGFDNTKQNKSGLLPLRTVLKERYLVGKALRINGEGVTYLGFDTSFEKAVWIREFAPLSLCRRDQNSVLLSPLPECAEAYAKLLADFVTLHKELARLPSVAAVLPTVDLFDQNGTCYTVADAFDGISFKEFLRRAGRELAWSDTKRFFMPVLNSLNTLGNAGILHLGISPETIYINRHGELKLADFCVRDLRVSGGSLKAELYPGYAPAEQYDPSLAVGAWSDLYAVAAVMYTALTLSSPPTAKQRTQNQRLAYASELNHGVPQAVSLALQNAMSLSPEERTQSFVEFIHKIARDDAAQDPVSERKTESDMKKPQEIKQKKPKQKNHAGLITFASIMIFTAIGLLIFTSLFENQIKEALHKNTSSVVSPGSSSQEASSGISSVAYGTLENYVGLPYSAVKDELNTMTAKVTVKEVYSEDYSEGMICGQDPAAYTSLDQVAGLTIQVSKGPESVPMPDIIGKPVEEARQTLYDLQIKYEEIAIYDDRYPEGYVARADRDIGEDVYIKKDNITVFVVKYNTASSGTSSKNHS